VLGWGADEDGNVVVFGEYASPGLVSKHAAEILERRKKWGTKTCWADPSVFAHHGISTPKKLARVDRDRIRRARHLPRPREP
jgi:hypothetical protein